MDSWKWEVKMRIAALQEVIQLLVSRFAGLLDLHGGSSSATATHRGLNTLAAMLLHSGRCYHSRDDNVCGHGGLSCRLRNAPRQATGVALGSCKEQMAGIRKLPELKIRQARPIPCRI